MNNFGVIELASAKTTSAPGWAYVPDTRLDPAAAASQPASRKRARNAGVDGGLSIGDLSARQEARVRKEIEALDKEPGRDAQIPVPLKNGKPHAGKTVNVRKILQSQKTFANHLDDYLALQAQNDAAAAAAAAAAAKRAPNKAAAAAAATAASGHVTDGHPTSDAPPTADRSSILTPSSRPPPRAHPGDHDPLLMSRVPEMPSDEELRRLLAHPPLSYVDAGATWPDAAGARYPTRKFCEVCGYWGRVRCMKCGTRVCALDCLETHREECVTRYGV